MRLPPHLVLLAALPVGCSSPPPAVDDDQDGVPASEDCDDSDPTIHPGAEEVCDGIDQDCDGEVDEGTQIALFEDADGDGFGGGGEPVLVCEAGEGLSLEDTDCDDGDTSVHPGAEETCDGIDEDCDGDVDEEAVDAVSWYADADEDGSGSDVEVVVACEAPQGMVAEAGDCDDADPEAAEFATWYLDEDDDGFGALDSEEWTCGQPEGTVADATDCDDADPTVYPGAEEVCLDGVVNDCEGSLEEAMAGCAWERDLDQSDAARVWSGSSSEPWITAATIIGDYDGDGTDDLALGSGHVDLEFIEAGQVWIFLGPAPTGGEDTSYADHVFEGGATRSHLGGTLASAGDVDGDGYDDLLVGANADSGGGRVYLLQGPATALDAASWVIEVEDDVAFGSLVASAPDVDVDGVSDFLIGAAHSSELASMAGALHVVSGASSGERSLEEVVLASFHGSESVAPLGREDTAAFVGDTDGDGLSDLVVGAPYHDSGPSRSAGTAMVFLQPFEEDNYEDDAVLHLEGPDRAGFRGSAVTAAGDVDGDGLHDYWLGAPGEDGGAASSGMVYLMPGGLIDNASVVDALASIEGSGRDDHFGGCVRTLDDSDGDGVSEVAICTGLSSADDGRTMWGGERVVYVFEADLAGSCSASDADHAIAGLREWFGAELAHGSGDLDGNGTADILVGAPADEGFYSEWFLFSPPVP